MGTGIWSCWLLPRRPWESFCSVLSLIVTGLTPVLCDDTETTAAECKTRVSGSQVGEIVSWNTHCCYTYEFVSKSFRTGHLEWELQMVKLSATTCSCIAILWVSLVSFVAITRQVFVVDVYFVIDSVRKLLDTHSYYNNTGELDSASSG
jgi:hypothetical protein